VPRVTRLATLVDSAFMAGSCHDDSAVRYRIGALHGMLLRHGFESIMQLPFGVTSARSGWRYLS
jgi:hypothetical protein